MRPGSLFDMHYKGSLKPDKKIITPKDIPKQDCYFSHHRNCGDCLRDMFDTVKILDHRFTGCLMCDLVKHTIFMRRGVDAEINFTRFESRLSKNIDYVSRACCARHLNSFVTNYITCAPHPADRAAALAVQWIVISEKINTTFAIGETLASKQPDVQADNDNFTVMPTSDTLNKTVGYMLDVITNPIIRRLSMSILAWAALDDTSLIGAGSEHTPNGKAKRWKLRVIDAYMS
ncbi:hypothetical protein TetV_646 [Tetraselmis virus 1]|uniref:Uncharacterized protein n=1 Tax=Tetraselmis virus 1 TaxID=2060617 RepID=A0A2P0VP92_9VIRU|nr:hypothetical protein QJ968_gp408 [Tetraselmis virus 1]AUF82728.1 hypothetical protein TetV_646 [Tetraselmis virus 1]